MKKMTRFLILFVMFFILSGCGVTEGNEVTKEKKDEVVESFLNEFFYFNKDDRYDALEKMSTQSCFKNLQMNRLPVKYDKYIMENDISVKVDEMEYEAIEENIYEFTVTFVSNNEAFSSPMKGTVKIKVIDEEVFIDEIIIY